MERLTRDLLSKILYALFFVGVFPVALALWAHGTSSVISLAPIQSQTLGIALFFAGVILCALGMLALWRRGGGLPMNAFPPPRFVADGIYGLIPHPIYVGFVLACAGTAIVTRSASGLWLITPCAALACSALVLGYELPDLRKRFGPRNASTWLPRAQSGPPSLLERIRVYFVVLLPWLALFELIGALGARPGSMATWMPFESSIPIVQSSELLYASTYLVVLLVPFAAPTGSALRRFARLGLIAMAVIFPLYLLLPIYVPPRPFTPTSLFGSMLLLERSPSSGTAAFPSFHVVWALIAASTLADSARPWKRILWWIWAALVAFSCITTGMHSVADVFAGALTYIFIARIDTIWKALLSAAERLANSWREARFGALRIINHGAYAGAAAFVGVCIIETHLGPNQTALTLCIFLFSIAGAALWAQWVEGSPALLRPMGFYGGMIGAVIGAAFAPLWHVKLITVLAAVCLAAPWIQAIGRLRCLVQGCCHGRAAANTLGIRYSHPRSRVCRLAHLQGIPLYATPVYSILCNVVSGLALLRLLALHVPAGFLCGVYLLLSSAGRFVEEAYRGEPQTRDFYGLHLYQWIAVLTAIIGAILTAIPGPPLETTDHLGLATVLLAIACGFATWFVTGMDFPESSRRFARLT